jgi:hypothetical protein
VPSETHDHLGVVVALLPELLDRLGQFSDLSGERVFSPKRHLACSFAAPPQRLVEQVAKLFGGLAPALLAYSHQLAVIVFVRSERRWL